MKLRTSAATAVLVFATVLSASAHGRSGRTSLVEVLGLTEDQQTALTALNEAYSVSRKALHEEKSGAKEAILTEEQLATLEDLRAESRHYRHGTSLSEALGLSDDQQAAMDAIGEAYREERIALSEAYKEDFEALLTPEQVDILADTSFGTRGGFCKWGKDAADDDEDADADSEGAMDSALNLGDQISTAVAETSWGALKSGLRR